MQVLFLWFHLLIFFHCCSGHTGFPKNSKFMILKQDFSTCCSLCLEYSFLQRASFPQVFYWMWSSERAFLIEKYSSLSLSLISHAHTHTYIHVYTHSFVLSPFPPLFYSVELTVTPLSYLFYFFYLLLLWGQKFYICLLLYP